MFGFGRKRRQAGAEAYGRLRRQLFDLDPATAGLSPGPAAQSWAFVMDSGIGSEVMTLVCLRDGTTSLYTTSGFVLIGGGAHAPVAAANEELFAVLDSVTEQMTADEDPQLPTKGMTALRAFTFGGRRVHVAADRQLLKSENPYAELFTAAHRVMTALRMAESGSSR